MRRAQPAGAVNASRNVRVFHAAARQQEGAASHLRGQQPSKARKTGTRAKPITTEPKTPGEKAGDNTGSDIDNRKPGTRTSSRNGIDGHKDRKAGKPIASRAGKRGTRSTGKADAQKPGREGVGGKRRLAGRLATTSVMSGRAAVGQAAGDHGDEYTEFRVPALAGHAISGTARLATSLKRRSGGTPAAEKAAEQATGKAAGKLRKGRKAVSSTGKAARSTGSTAVRHAQAVYRQAVRAFESVKAMAATAVAALTTAPVLAGVLAVAMIAALMLSLLMPATASASCGYGSVKVPEQAQPWVDEAAATSGLGKPLIAAIMSQESGFRPDAYADDSNGGTWGLLQMNRSVWRGVHPQGADQTPPEGITDPMTHAHYGGVYLKNRMDGVKALKASHPGAAFAQLSDEDALIIAHNAGEGNLMKYPGIPQSTRKYFENVHRMTGGGESCNVDEGATVGRLSPPLVMNSDGYHINVEATGTDQSSTTYERFQCTWWAFIRRRQIGKPVDPYMGNGGFWADKARSLGMGVGGGPRPGDAVSFRPGVHGSSPQYGHVAIVEQVNDDGSIIISQSGTGWMAVVIETITARQLQAMGDGVVFIH